MLLFCQALKQIQQFQQNNLFVMKFNMLEKNLYWQYISFVQKAPNYAANLKETDLRLRIFYGTALLSSTDHPNSIINRILCH